MALNFEVVAKAPATAKAIGIPVASEGALPKEVTLSRATLETLGFTGKVGQTYVVPAEKGAASILIGVGEVSKLDATSLRKASAAFARAAAGFESVSTTLANIGRLDRKVAAQVVVEGMSLATHRYTDLKTVDKKAPKLATVSLVGTGAATTGGVKRGQVIANATNMARDFANMPPAYLTATIFANKAVEIAG